MLIQKVSVSLLKPHPDNPRITLTPEDIEYQQIEKSIDINGYILPLVWNKRSGYLISGHQRLPVLVSRGMKEIEVVVVDLDPQAERRLLVGLNKITGRWDNQKLAAMLDDMVKMPDFDSDIIGFTMPEISQILDRYGEQKDADDFDFQGTLNTIEAPVTKRGDLVELGSHKILCGDSSSLEDLKLLMGTRKVNLVHADPPYNIRYMGGARPTAKGRPKKSREWERIYADNMVQKDYIAGQKKVLTNVSQFLAPGAPVYIWNAHKNFGPMHDMLTELNFHVASVIVWAKPNFAISYSDYHEQVEFCLYSWRKDKGSHKWYGPVNESSLWDSRRDVTRNYIHPTQKPVALAQRAIRNSSVRGDCVLDMFLGSGSTLIAAETLGRCCYGLEIDCKYVDGIVRRYIDFVGRDKVSSKVLNKYFKEVKNEK